MTKSDKLENIFIAVLLSIVLWSFFALYNLRYEPEGFGVEVYCADQSEACEDAIEDLNQGVM